MSEVNFYSDGFQISLKAARVNKGIKIDDVAKALNTTKQTIINYESGKTSPTIDTVIKLCDLYSVPIDKLSFLPKSDN